MDSSPREPDENPWASPRPIREVGPDGEPLSRPAWYRLSDWIAVFVTVSFFAPPVAVLVSTIVLTGSIYRSRGGKVIVPLSEWSSKQRVVAVVAAILMAFMMPFATGFGLIQSEQSRPPVIRRWLSSLAWQADGVKEWLTDKKENCPIR